MDFVLTLHSHLPYVLHHGRWPHGSDWLCEAAIDTYLPLIEQLQALAADDVVAPLTIGITPVLANQLAHPDFPAELEHLLQERLKACTKAEPELTQSGEQALLPLVAYWRARLERLRNLFYALDGDLVSAFRGFQQRGQLEIIGSAATHGYLPLCSRDESIRLQLETGYHEHRRLFHASPRGIWLPECAYRPRGPWSPEGATPAAERAGIEEHLAAVGFEFFFVDAHLAAAGSPLGTYHDVPLGIERFDAERHHAPASRPGVARRSPYWAYGLTPDGDRSVRAFVRDPRSSMQVWSRDRGYPGDEWYLEFHKIRWPGGLKLWRVTGPRVDLGAKQPYVPGAASGRVYEHARHFVSLLHDIVVSRGGIGDVVVAPFDTELFGHWWFEGIDFIGQLYRHIAAAPTLHAATASEHLDRHQGGPGIRLAEGSWGANGDHGMWLNDATRWTWDRLWPLEDRFWAVAPTALANEHTRPLVAQAARELLLAQSSDWQFIISTGAAADYAEERFRLHCDGADELLDILARDMSTADLAHGRRRAEELRHRDDVFPEILASLEAVVASYPSVSHR